MLLAALPSTPVQLMHACYRFGFDVVIPASWGDELVATHVLEDLRHRNRDPVIQCTCPLVSERLLANGQHLLRSMVQTAAPAVAASRYARHELSPRTIHVTYIGACPGARHPAIDERIMPDEFIRMLDEQDIAIGDMPPVFDSVLPPDRRRFVSLPGGCPTQEALWQASDGRMLREVTQPTFATDLAQTLVWREYVMVDVAPSLGCACAGGFSRLGARFGRVAVTALEPPRASHPVVAWQPDFTTPVEEPEVPITRNGDTPAEFDSDHGSARLESEGHEAPDASGVAPPKVRVRSPASAPLPRAYLAKRRHLTQRDALPQAPDISDEPETHVDAAAPDVQRTPNERQSDVQRRPVDAPLVPNTFASESAHGPKSAHGPESGHMAEAGAVAVEDVAQTELPLSELREPSQPPPPTLESQGAVIEAAEVPLTIAVHVEPDAAADVEISAVPTTTTLATAPVGSIEVEITTHAPSPSPAPPHPPDAATQEVAAAPTTDVQPAAPLPPAAQARDPEEDLPPALREVLESSEREEIGPAVAVADEEERDSFAPPRGPLRVEVEIFEEPAAQPEVVVPEVIIHEEPPAASQEVAAEVTAPAERVWGDLLIALWLVLVASAVIASLVWRR